VLDAGLLLFLAKYRRYTHNPLANKSGADGWKRGGQACSSGPSLWLSVRPFGNVRGDPFQNEFADQIRHRIRTRARQTIEND
jgi:hypothetical protein